ncbi:uncharacterized protein [Littorina saxatilis]|uniref:uncharacterized protein isoform X2 n=1 Tax=Littorina saxatilis TaxID=31220 RepID=UPI0038B665B7
MSSVVFFFLICIPGEASKRRAVLFVSSSLNTNAGPQPYPAYGQPPHGYPPQCQPGPYPTHPGMPGAYQPGAYPPGAYPPGYPPGAPAAYPAPPGQVVVPGLFDAGARFDGTAQPNIPPTQCPSLTTPTVNHPTATPLRVSQDNTPPLQACLGHTCPVPLRPTLLLQDRWLYLDCLMLVLALVEQLHPIFHLPHQGTAPT